MRLLWMKSDYVVPPDTGGKIRTYHLLRELHQLCDVTYLSFKAARTPNNEPEMRGCASRIATVHRGEERKQGPAFYARVLRGMASRLPYTLQKYRSAAMREQQRQFWKSGDGEPGVILCDFLEMAENVDWSLPCPKVLFQHNVESTIWRRYRETEANPLKRAYFHFESRRMRRYEAAACDRFDLVFTVSAQDRDRLRDEFGVRRPIEVLETAVDAGFFTPGPSTDVQPGRLVFLGSLDWMPNIDGLQWFLAEVFPRIRARRPQATLDIVGRRPSGQVRRMAEQDGVRLAADVADVRPYISACDVFVVPLRIGGGSRIKIYEAMAMRRPVVSTTIGAEGLPLTSGRHLAVGDSPEQFAAEVVGLLQDRRLNETMATAGFQLVSENHQWKNVAGKLYQCCRDLIENL